MVTKISKWSRIQDSCRITPKIESLVAYAMPDLPSKFQKDPSITFWVILLTNRQTDKQTKIGKNITSLAEVTSIRIVTGVAVSIKIFWPKVRKMLPQSRRSRETFYEPRAKKSMMIDSASHYLFCYTSYQNKTLNTNYFNKKALTTSMLAAQCCQRGATLRCQCCPRGQQLCICKCHVTRCEPIACRYFALRYNNNLKY